MTKEEMKMVVEVFAQADGGCKVCVSSLIDSFAIKMNVPYLEMLFFLKGTDNGEDPYWLQEEISYALKRSSS